MRTFALIALLVFPIALFAQNPAQEEDEDESSAQKDSVRGFQFKFKDRPSLRYGEDFRLDVKTKWHFDFRHFNPPIAKTSDINDSFSLTRARFSFKGKVTKYFDYEVERELRGTFAPLFVDPELVGDYRPRHPWRDVYVDFQPFSFLRLKVGKFKTPFGMEENTSEDKLDFVYRSQVTESLTGGRQRGAMLHGKFLKGKRLEYQVGMFRFDGENTEIKGIPTARRTWVTRLSGEPLRYVRMLPRTIRHTYLGVAATTGNMDTGANSIRGRTVSGITYFDYLRVQGERRRIGAEFSWSDGPFGLRGEYIHVSEERIGQAISSRNQPANKLTRGWYMTGSWMVYGKAKGKDPSKPFMPLLGGKGYGAVEVAARFDVLSFYSDPDASICATSCPPARDPRAVNILPNHDRTWTFGATWYVNHFVKLQANAEREWIADIRGPSVSGPQTFWTSVFRLQFAM